MLRKIAAVGMLALCSFASGCWFNSPCCSPYDKAGPTFGGDPSVPDDFNYRKGSILGSDTSVGNVYIDGDAGQATDDGTVYDDYSQQAQPVRQPVQQARRYPGPTRSAYPMNQGASYQGMRNQGGGNQGSAAQGAGYQQGGFQGAGSYRGSSNPAYQSRRNNRTAYEYEEEYEDEDRYEDDAK
jgi:hypothetical protein